MDKTNEIAVTIELQVSQDRKCAIVLVRAEDRIPGELLVSILEDFAKKMKESLQKKTGIEIVKKPGLITP